METNRGWVKKAVARQQTDVPWNVSFSPPALEAVRRRYGADDIKNALDFPIRMTAPVTIKPLYASPETYGDTITDEFGVTWTTSEIDRGSPVGPCLREPDLSKYTFPDPSVRYRFETLGKWCEANAEHFTIIWVGDLWERATFMRGMENLLLDVVLHPKFVEDLLRGLTDYVLETMRILFERFRFDCVALSDDYGTQKALVMSPEHWRKFLKPRLAEIYGLAGKHGRTVFHHSCGNNTAIIGDFIDVGLDILHPIQPEAMDIVALKREYGKELSFCGGVRTQDLLPRGTPEEVRAEVRRLKHEMGRGGGYILEPGITVQADVPVENIAAMIDEARGTD